MRKSKILIFSETKPPHGEIYKSLAHFAENGEIFTSNAVEVRAEIERLKPDLLLIYSDPNDARSSQFETLMQKAIALPPTFFVMVDAHGATRAFEINDLENPINSGRRNHLRKIAAQFCETLNEEPLLSDTKAEAETAFDEPEIESQSPTKLGNYLERIAIRRQNEIFLLPVEDIIFITADLSMLRFTTVKNEDYSTNYRLKDLAARLDPARFVKISRSAVGNIKYISSLSLIANNYYVNFTSGQQLPVSRFQSRVLREGIFKLLM